MPQIKVTKYLVTNLVESLDINSPTGDKTTLNFATLGFAGMLPVFNTPKGAEDYVGTLKDKATIVPLVTNIITKDGEKTDTQTEA